MGFINGKIKRIYFRFLYVLRIKKPVGIAKKLGVTIGNDCKILDDPTKMFGTEPYLIKMGDHVELTNGVRFTAHDGSVWVIRVKEEYKNSDYFAPIVIGNNVFIGMNSVVLPGAQIGNNVIIGAGSIVKGKIPDNTVAAGVPAKVIKTLDEFENKIKPQLLETKMYAAAEKEMFIKKMKPDWF